MIDFTSIGQPSQLLLKYLLDRPLAWAPERTIHYRDLREMTYRDFFERVQQRLICSLVWASAKGTASGSWTWTATATWSYSSPCR